MLRLCAVLLALNLVACNLSLPTSDEVGQKLTLAWASAGDLWVWRTGETAPRRVASGGVIRPWVSPDGQRIAYTRGANGQAQTLWVVDSRGLAEQQLIGPNNPRGYDPNSLRIGDIAWWDEVILYFNTLTLQGPGLSARNDLYRANARTREAAQILRPGRGGRFVFSPDKQQIAVVSSGRYNVGDGRISVVDPLGQRELRILLYFKGIASGSHSTYSLQVSWSRDSAALYAAIPHPDLVFQDTEDAEKLPPTILWVLPSANPAQRRQVGQVQASFFGLPTYSDAAGRWLYIQRQPASNRFRLLLAEPDGTEIGEIASGLAGEISAPNWIMGGPGYAFARGPLAQVWHGQADQDAPPALLDERATLEVLWLDAARYVFQTALEGGGSAFFIGRVGGSSQALVRADEYASYFSAALGP
ncbi:MAG: hypothetical protein NZ750_12150 [Anaerolineae bacterium]|nr:hypothetical protein [Anaerolineae bacterium]MDW8173885.1 hypothetical protein [Anaerolineae bacterium]